MSGVQSGQQGLLPPGWTELPDGRVVPAGDWSSGSQTGSRSGPAQIVCVGQPDQPPVFQGLLNPDGTVALLDGAGDQVGLGTFGADGKSLQVALNGGSPQSIDLTGTRLQVTAGTGVSELAVMPDGHLQSLLVGGPGGLPQVIAFRPDHTQPPFTLGATNPDGTVAIMDLAGHQIGLGTFDSQGSVLDIRLDDGMARTAEMLFRGLLNPDGSVTLMDGAGHTLGTGTVLDHSHLLQVKLADGQVQTIDLGGSTIEASRGSERLTFSVGSDGTLQLSSMSVVSDGKLTIPMGGNAAGLLVPAGVVATFTTAGQVLLNGQPVTQRKNGSGTTPTGSSTTGSAQTSSATAAVVDDPWIRLTDGTWVRLSDYLDHLNAAAAEVKADPNDEQAYLSWLSLLSEYDPNGSDPTVQMDDGTTMSVQDMVQGQLQQAYDAENKYIGQMTYDISQMFEFRDTLWNQSDAALSGMSVLQANMSGLDDALGGSDGSFSFCTGDLTNGVRFCDVWQTVQQQITALANGYFQVGLGLHQSGCQLLATEEANVTNFGSAVGNPAAWQVQDEWNAHPFSPGQLRLMRDNPDASPNFTELAVPVDWRTEPAVPTDPNAPKRYTSPDVTAIRVYAQTLRVGAGTYHDLAYTCDMQYRSCTGNWQGQAADDLESMWLANFSLSSDLPVQPQRGAAGLSAYKPIDAIINNLYQLASMLDGYANVVETVPEIQTQEVITSLILTGTVALSILTGGLVDSAVEAVADFATSRLGWTAVAGQRAAWMVGASLNLGFNAAIGGATFGASDISTQLVHGTAWAKVDWGQVWHDAGYGAIIGGVTSLFAVGLAPAIARIGNAALKGISTALSGGVGAFLGDLAAEALLDRKVDVGHALGTGATASVLGGAFELLGSSIADSGSPTRPAFAISVTDEGGGLRTYTGLVTPQGDLIVDNGNLPRTPGRLWFETDPQGNRHFFFLPREGGSPLSANGIDFSTPKVVARFFNAQSGWTFESAGLQVEGDGLRLQLAEGSLLPPGVNRAGGGLWVPRGWAVGVDLESGAVHLIQPANASTEGTTWVFSAADDGKLSLAAGYRSGDGMPVAMVFGGKQLVPLDPQAADVYFTVFGGDGVRYVGFVSTDGTVSVFGQAGYRAEGSLPVPMTSPQRGPLRTLDGLTFKLNGQPTTLEGEWLRVVGGGRAETYRVIEGGLAPVRAEALRDGGLVLKTPAGEVSLPRGSVVDLLQDGSKRALVTASGGTTPFKVDDWTFIKDGDTRPAPAPVVRGGPAAADVVEGDLLGYVLDNGFTVAPAPGGVGVYDSQGQLRYTRTPDGHIIVHPGPAGESPGVSNGAVATASAEADAASVTEPGGAMSPASQIDPAAGFPGGTETLVPPVPGEVRATASLRTIPLEVSAMANTDALTTGAGLQAGSPGMSPPSAASGSPHPAMTPTTELPVLVPAEPSSQSGQSGAAIVIHAAGSPKPIVGEGGAPGAHPTISLPGRNPLFFFSPAAHEGGGVGKQVPHESTGGGHPASEPETSSGQQQQPAPLQNQPQQPHRQQGAPQNPKLDKPAEQAGQQAASSTIPVDEEKVGSVQAATVPEKGMPEWAVYTQTPEVLYYPSSQEPELILNEGVRPPDMTSTDLVGHLRGLVDTVFISLTRDPTFLSFEQYQYEIDAPAGLIDMAASSRAFPAPPGWAHPEQQIVVSIGSIPRERIRGVRRVGPNGELGNLIPNEHYDPGLTSSPHRPGQQGGSAVNQGFLSRTLPAAPRSTTAADLRAADLRGLLVRAPRAVELLLGRSAASVVQGITLADGELSPLVRFSPATGLVSLSPQAADAIRQIYEAQSAGRQLSTEEVQHARLALRILVRKLVQGTFRADSPWVWLAENDQLAAVGDAFDSYRSSYGQDLEEGRTDWAAQAIFDDFLYVTGLLEVEPRLPEIRSPLEDEHATAVEMVRHFAKDGGAMLLGYADVDECCVALALQSSQSLIHWVAGRMAAAPANGLHSDEATLAALEQAVERAFETGSAARALDILRGEVETQRLQSSRQALTQSPVDETGGDGRSRIELLVSGRERYEPADPSTIEWLRKELEFQDAVSQEGSGLRTVIGRTKYGAGRLGSGLKIVDRNGQIVGSAEYAIELTNGRLEASIIDLRLTQSFRGKGFGGRWQRRLIEFFKRQGVVRVRVHAASEGGGYLWALHGFDFLTADDRSAALRRVMERVKSGLMSARGVADWQALVRAWVVEGRAPRPLDLAFIGYDPRLGRGPGATWDGKEIMRGAAYLAELRLETQAPPQSASEPSLRPSLREGAPGEMKSAQAHEGVALSFVTTEGVVTLSTGQRAEWNDDILRVYSESGTLLHVYEFRSGAGSSWPDPPWAQPNRWQGPAEWDDGWQTEQPGHHDEGSAWLEKALYAYLSDGGGARPQPPEEPEAGQQSIEPAHRHAGQTGQPAVESQTSEQSVSVRGGQGSSSGGLFTEADLEGFPSQIKLAGTPGQIPANENGDPIKGLEIAAGPVNTVLPLPPEPNQPDLTVVDPRLVELTRTDITGRSGVLVLDATQPIPQTLHDMDFIILNNPYGFTVDIGAIGQAVRPGGRIVIQGFAEVAPGMRPANPYMTRLLKAVRAGNVPAGYRVVEILTDPTLPGGGRGGPVAMEKPSWVLGGDTGFNQTSGRPASWPNTRIVIERLADGVPTPPVPPEVHPNGPAEPVVEPPDSSGSPSGSGSMKSAQAHDGLTLRFVTEQGVVTLAAGQRAEWNDEVLMVYPDDGAAPHVYWFRPGPGMNPPAPPWAQPSMSQDPTEDDWLKQELGPWSPRRMKGHPSEGNRFPFEAHLSDGLGGAGRSEQGRGQQAAGPDRRTLSELTRDVEALTREAQGQLPGLELFQPLVDGYLDGVRELIRPEVDAVYRAAAQAAEGLSGGQQDEREAFLAAMDGYWEVVSERRWLALRALADWLLRVARLPVTAVERWRQELSRAETRLAALRGMGEPAEADLARTEQALAGVRAAVATAEAAVASLRTLAQALVRGDDAGIASALPAATSLPGSVPEALAAGGSLRAAPPPAPSLLASPLEAWVDALRRENLALYKLMQAASAVGESAAVKALQQQANERRDTIQELTTQAQADQQALQQALAGAGGVAAARRYLDGRIEPFEERLVRGQPAPFDGQQLLALRLVRETLPGSPGQRLLAYWEPVAAEARTWAALAKAVQLLAGWESRVAGLFLAYARGRAQVPEALVDRLVAIVSTQPPDAVPGAVREALDAHALTVRGSYERFQAVVQEVVDATAPSDEELEQGRTRLASTRAGLALTLQEVRELVDASILEAVERTEADAEEARRTVEANLAAAAGGKARQAGEAGLGLDHERMARWLLERQIAVLRTAGAAPDVLDGALQAPGHGDPEALRESLSQVMREAQTVGSTDVVAALEAIETLLTVPAASEEPLPAAWLEALAASLEARSHALGYDTLAGRAADRLAGQLRQTLRLPGELSALMDEAAELLQDAARTVELVDLLTPLLQGGDLVVWPDDLYELIRQRLEDLDVAQSAGWSALDEALRRYAAAVRPPLGSFVALVWAKLVEPLEQLANELGPRLDAARKQIAGQWLQDPAETDLWAAIVDDVEPVVEAVSLVRTAVRGAATPMMEAFRNAGAGNEKPPVAGDVLWPLRARLDVLQAQVLQAGELRAAVQTLIEELAGADVGLAARLRELLDALDAKALAIEEESIGPLTRHLAELEALLSHDFLNAAREYLDGQLRAADTPARKAWAARPVRERPVADLTVEWLARAMLRGLPPSATGRLRVDGMALWLVRASLRQGPDQPDELESEPAAAPPDWSELLGLAGHLQRALEQAAPLEDAGDAGTAGSERLTPGQVLEMLFELEDADLLVSAWMEDFLEWESGVSAFVSAFVENVSQLSARASALIRKARAVEQEMRTSPDYGPALARIITEELTVKGGGLLELSEGVFRVARQADTLAVKLAPDLAEERRATALLAGRGVPMAYLGGVRASVGPGREEVDGILMWFVLEGSPSFRLQLDGQEIDRLPVAEPYLRIFAGRLADALERLLAAVSGGHGISPIEIASIRVLPGQHGDVRFVAPRGVHEVGAGDAERLRDVARQADLLRRLIDQLRGGPESPGSPARETPRPPAPGSGARGLTGPKTEVPEEAGEAEAPPESEEQQGRKGSVGQRAESIVDRQASLNESLLQIADYVADPCLEAQPDGPDCMRKLELVRKMLQSAYELAHGPR